MKCNTLKEFKNQLQDSINNQDIIELSNLCDCPSLGTNICANCFLSDENCPKELTGSWTSCILGSMKDVYWDYYILNEINEKDTLARFILMGVKILAYLNSKE